MSLPQIAKVLRFTGCGKATTLTNLLQSVYCGIPYCQTHPFHLMCALGLK